MKRVIGIIMSIIIIFTTLNLSAFSADVQPTHTESWSTGYYTQSDPHTTYLFVRCQADVYADGTVKLYMWNVGTPKLSDDDTVIMLGTDPYAVDSIQYAAYTKTTLQGNDYRYVPTTTNFVDVSYYPSNYSIRQIGGYYTVFTKTGTSYCIADITLNNRNCAKMYTSCANVQCVPAYESRPDTPAFEFTMKTEIVKEAKFRLFGHDITLYPSDGGTVTADANERISDKDIKIRELEAEIAELKSTIESQKCEINYLNYATNSVDSNKNGVVDLIDCRRVLEYYTYSFVGLESGKVEDYVNFLATK